MISRMFLSLAIVASGAAACSSAQASALGATCDDFDRTPGIRQSVEIPLGGETTIVLCSNPSTGFGWTEPQILDAGVLRLVDTTYSGPDAANLPIVGAAGGQVLKIRGLAVGRTALSTSYDRSWAGGEKGHWAYTVDVTVR